MKTKSSRRFAALVAGSAALLFTGCSDRQQAKAKDAMSEAKATAKETWQDTQTATAEAWDDLAAATYDERMAFKSEVNDLATSIDRKTDQLAEKSSDLPADARAAWDNGMDELQEARAELSHELDQLGDATADTWDETKDRVASAWHKVEAAYQDLADRIAS